MIYILFAITVILVSGYFGELWIASTTAIFYAMLLIAGMRQETKERGKPLAERFLRRFGASRVFWTKYVFFVVASFVISALLYGLGHLIQKIT